MKSFAIIYCCLFSFGLLAQDLRPIFSDDVVVPKREFLLESVQKSDDKIVFITESMDEGYRNNYICTYRPNKKLQRNLLKSPLKNAFGYKFFTLDGKVYRWYMSKHKKSKAILRSIVEFDLEGKAKKKAKAMKSIPYNRYEDQPSQSIYYSPDSSKILAVEIIDENHKKDPVSISLVVLEKGLVSSHERTFKGKEKSQLTTDHCVARITNNGEAYLLQKVIPGAKIQKMVNNKVLPNYYYELIRVTADGKTKAYRIKDLKDFSNTENLFITDEGHPMVLTGINESSKESAALIGFNCHVYNVEADSFELKKTTFRSKLKKWGVTKDLSYKQLFSFFELHKDYLIDDGQIHVLFERSYFDIKGKGRKGAHTVNVKKTALAFTISNDGKVTEDLYVPKIHDAKRPTVSTKLISANNQLYLIYLLNEINKNGPLDDLLFFENARDFIGNSTIFCLATKQEGEVMKWNIRDSNELNLYTELIHSSSEKVYIPIIDYLPPTNARFGLLTMPLPK